ncbi:MAG: hypothetical protein IJ113_02385 [Eggerthellaceae bacterium]|nr:hypothetical protein [Eggerthellaceae bacterium]
MIVGTSITVLRPGEPVVDRFHNAIPGKPVEERVDNVLIAPGTTAELEASRPEGAVVAFTLHFPKGYSKSLEGCHVKLPAPWEGTYRVIGAPRPYMDANTPTRWHMPVEVEDAHG